MKKLIMFFSGLVILALMFIALWFTSAIYDTANKINVETYFFQTNNLSAQRAGVPATADELGDELVRDMLIERYLTEYFYVIPDTNDVLNRVGGRTGLYNMSVRAVFDDWRTNVAPTIQKLAEDKVLRAVSVVSITPPTDGAYWTIVYKMETWDRPNDFYVAPTVSYGNIYLNIRFEPGMREQVRGMPVEQFLEQGGDPAATFKFMVLDVATER